MNDLSKVSFRLKVAQVYNAFIESFPDNSSDEAASHVAAEVKAFIEGRLEVLMGVKAEANAKDTLTPQEIGVLKLLVAKLIAGEELDLDTPESVSTPALQSAAPTTNLSPALEAKIKKKLTAKEKKAAKAVKDGIEQLPDGTKVWVQNGRRFVQVVSREGTPVYRRNPETGEFLKDKQGNPEPVLTEIHLNERPEQPRPPGPSQQQLAAFMEQQAVAQSAGFEKSVEKLFGG